MEAKPFQVLLTTSAKGMLRRIGKKFGKNTYEHIRELIKGLAFEPDRKGEPLRGALHGLYSCHYSRFRIIYQIKAAKVEVIVVATGFHESGSRDDIYEVVKRLVESGRITLGP